MTETTAKNWKADCLYDGWRLDSHHVKAADAAHAKARVRNRYHPSARRRVTGITVYPMPTPAERCALATPTERPAHAS